MVTLLMDISPKKQIKYWNHWNCCAVLITFFNAPPLVMVDSLHRQLFSAFLNLFWLFYCPENTSWLSHDIQQLFFKFGLCIYTSYVSELLTSVLHYAIIFKTRLIKEVKMFDFGYDCRGFLTKHGPSTHRYAPVNPNFKSASGHNYVRIKGRSYRASRIIWAMHHGGTIPDRVYYKDGNSYNDKVENLSIDKKDQFKKVLYSVRLECDILEWLRAQPCATDTINSILRRYMNEESKTTL